MSFDRIIENVVLTDTLVLEGTDWDNTLIRNVIIKDVSGNGILLRDVANVRIENVTIHNVTGDGIKLSTQGGTRDVVIVDSHLHDIGQDGINAGQRDDNDVDHPGLRILNNTLEDVAQNGRGDGMLHGIYVQSTDYVIDGNIIHGVPDGNGISVRSSGQVSNNHISETEQSGIAYFANNYKGSSDALVIRDNVLADTGRDGLRSPIDLLEVYNRWEEQVVSRIDITNNRVTAVDVPVVGIAPDYADLAVDITQEGNRVIAPIEAGAAGFGDPDGDPEIAPLPAEQIEWPLMSEDNVRLMLANSGFGESRVLLSVGQAAPEVRTLDPGTILRVSNFHEVGLSVYATSGHSEALLSVDAGRVGVLSEGEDMAFAGDRPVLISGDETLRFYLEDTEMTQVTQVAVGLDYVSDGETVTLELWSNGVFLADVTRAATSVVQIETDVAFDQVRLAAGTDSDFALSFFEFGTSATPTLPQGDQIEVATVSAGGSLTTSVGGGSFAQVVQNSVEANSYSLPTGTRAAEVNLNEIGVKLAGVDGVVAIDAGQMYITGDDELGTDAELIAGDDQFVFSLKPVDGVGDATSAVLDLSDFSAGETVILEAFHDGMYLGQTVHTGGDEIVFSTHGVFDALVVRAGEGSDFALTGFEFQRLDLDLGLA